ncbi:hypothetical protein M427DRAFT_38662 [Gonapodya prolifera JEL478]|uniref:Uncharacterized protein n=1 Tax=Gonapodya prolifera (strain JEL478) TaxID=1344416 RepID=A0A138ZZN9_GONPJ|nr:hypothetical protein M427DRAFT_38662 [Gonapodya prolifera JEL478]|eukprot:KXS09603.1 hypothetical protein M427DRAFT_38662 [Gonapodya prolifera JEL478]
MELPDSPESETGQHTPKHSKPKATRGPPLVHPFTLPTITLINLQTLEDALKEFLMEHGQTADFKLAPTFQSHLQGLQDLALNKILTPKGILVEYNSTLRDFSNFGAQNISLTHLAFQPCTGQSKKEASNNGMIFSATNAMAQYEVASKSPSPINWSEGSKWQCTWAFTNFLGPYTVPDADVLSKATKPMQKVPLSVVVEDDLKDLVTFDIPPEGGPSGVDILHNSQGVPLDSEENKLEEPAESEPLMDPSLGEALEKEAEEIETEDEEPTPSCQRHIPQPTPALPTSAPLKGTVEEGDEEESEEVPSTLVDTQPAPPPKNSRERPLLTTTTISRRTCFQAPQTCLLGQDISEPRGGRQILQEK